MTMRSLFIAYDLLRLVAAKTAVGTKLPCDETIADGCFDPKQQLDYGLIGWK